MSSNERKPETTPVTIYVKKDSFFKRVAAGIVSRTLVAVATWVWDHWH
ncbi:hypothetical protein [Streptomyces sp. NPDC091217]